MKGKPLVKDDPRTKAISASGGEATKITFARRGPYKRRK